MGDFKSSQVKSSQSHTTHPASVGTGEYHIDGFGPTLKAIKTRDCVGFTPPTPKGSCPDFWCCLPVWLPHQCQQPRHTDHAVLHTLVSFRDSIEDRRHRASRATASPRDLRQKKRQVGTKEALAVAIFSERRLLHEQSYHALPLWSAGAYPRSQHRPMYARPMSCSMPYSPVPKRWLHQV